MTDAEISMDALKETQEDRPEFGLTNLPLPVIHKDVSFPARQIATSRKMGQPIDTSSVEAAARRVSEQMEKLALGVASSFTYGGGSVYGLTNFPNRITRTITSPEAGDWDGGTFVEDVLDMRQDAQDAYHYGPYVLFVSPSWDRYLDEDFKADSDITVRERVAKINGISDIMTLDYLTGYSALLVQLTSDVVRMVTAMDITTVQWSSKGDLQKHYKVMGVIVPQVRADHNTNTGVVHGSP
jgi:uncharacterized linocin/CFP29 family protein